MKKILITHISNTLNYGSAMMAINLIYYLHKRMPNAEIYCECNELNINRLKEATGYQELKTYQHTASPAPNVLRKIYNLLSGNHEIVRQVCAQFDVMIVLGGDDLSEVYQRNAISSELIYYHINRKGCKVVLLSQNIGPYSGIYKVIASYLLKKIAISTRDQRNYEYLDKKLRLQNVIETRDLAFLPLPYQEKYSKLAKEKIPMGRYVVMVPSGVFLHYGLNLQQAIKAWNEITELLLTIYDHYYIVILGHVLAPPSSDDRQIILPLAEIHKNNPRVITMTEEMQPAEARDIIESSEMVLTGRMHAAVSALAMGKMPLALAYSEKYFGVIARGFNLPESVVDCRNGRMLHSGFINSVMNNILQINKNKAEIESKIRFELKKTLDLSNKNIDLVIHCITNN